MVFDQWDVFNPVEVILDSDDGVRSGEQRHAAIGAQQRVGRGPALDDTDDDLAAAVDEATGRVKESPT